MQDMEKTVAVTQPDSVSDDAVQDQATENTQSELEQFLSSVEGEAHKADAQDTETREETQTSEAEPEVPKGIKGRIQAAEAKAAATRAATAMQAFLQSQPSLQAQTATTRQKA